MSFLSIKSTTCYLGLELASLHDVSPMLSMDNFTKQLLKPF